MELDNSALRKSEYTFTSESVSEGHPDKICDQISDAILDKFLSVNPVARVAVETMAFTDNVVISGEVRGVEDVSDSEIEDVIRGVIMRIGYDQKGFSYKDVKISLNLNQQSADIAQGVDAAGEKDEGAGDQGIMFGYATDETEVLMPAALGYSSRILKSLAKARHAGEADILGPDAKSQVSLIYKDGMPVKAKSIVVSTQHSEGVDQKEIRELVRAHVLKSLPDESWMCDEDEFYVNPTGKFVIGGPVGDAGLTGRKIIVDTYGGAAPHGGGAFSGKDPTKVDRSAAYVARYLAKNVVAAGIAKHCIIQLSYAIGVSKPISFFVNTRKTSKIDEAELERVLPELINLTPRGIREHLQLNKPIYERTAAYGHFGRKPDADGGFSWEQLDLVDKLKSHFNI